MHIENLFPLKRRLLAIGTNWLGDSVMSMPALQALRAARPDAHLTVLVKPPLVPLWRMHPAVDAVLAAADGVGGTLRAAADIRRGGYEQCLVFPNSFRSGLLPWLGRTPERIGARGHGRAWLLTRLIDTAGSRTSRHQAWEYFAIAGLRTEDAALLQPVLRAPAEATAEAERLLGETARGARWVGLVPGAARGPSKQWPAAHFVALGRMLMEQGGDVRLAVLGTAAETAVCTEVSQGLGPRALNLAGRTSLQSLAAVLARCRVVVANDSGAMHLATAMGTRVAALFGLTDPSKTGPLGRGHTVLTPEGAVKVSRDIARDSAEARAALASIAPARVAAAVLPLI